MPELPEVETVRNTLKRMILGETVKCVNVMYTGIIKSDLIEFKTKLVGETLTDILRYGKYLIFVFNNYSIISHLRMEGKYFVKSESDPYETHEHVEFVYKSGRALRYHDTRKFGTMKLVPYTKFSDIMNDPELKKLAPEANDENFDPNFLYMNLQTSTPIKTMLLTQEVICGLGNIYADEVCFDCNINPLMPSKEVSFEMCEKLLASSRKILKKAIECGGTTIRSYTSSLGVTGRFQQELMVHQREGETCKVCGSTIIKTTCGGRGTYICPKCEKYPKTVYGITGSIATGKSTVLNYLKEQGCKIISCDAVVAYLYERNDVKKVLEDIFGEDAVINGVVNRRYISNIVFNDEYKKKQLEDYIHPYVKKVINFELAITCKSKVYIEIPLLFEANFFDVCDKVVVVYLPKDLEIKRLMARNNIGYEEALMLVNSQYPIEEKVKRADYVIDNSGSIDDIYKQIKESIL